MTTRINDPVNDPGCFIGMFVIIIVVIFTVGMILFSFNSNAQPVASAARETYQKVDPCFWEVVEISPKVTSLYELMMRLENTDCFSFMFPPHLIRQYRIKIRKTKGPPLELLHDAIRETNLMIEAVPSVGTEFKFKVLIYRKATDKL
jgi:hypothetical protein